MPALPQGSRFRASGCEAECDGGDAGAHAGLPSERTAFSNRNAIVVTSLALIVDACGAPSSLTVQLQSDLVAGAEVDHVEVVLTDSSGASVATRELELTRGHSLARPVRVAMLDLAAGTYDIRVTLSSHGVPLQSRPARTALPERRS